MSRRIVTVTLLLASTWATALGRGEEAAPGKPHIVIILADDLGYGDVRALSPESKIPTPNLDRLASEGVTFTDGHSPSAVCTPTRYGLLTGRYAWRTRLKRGVLGGYSPPLLAPDRPTIASMLREQGYRTGAVGKWHLGMSLPFEEDTKDGSAKWDGDPGIDFGGVITDGPTHHGFDSYFGVSASLDMAPYVFIRDDRFTKLPTKQQDALRFPRFVRKGPRAEDFDLAGVLDRLTTEATAFIEDAAKGDRPFFLYFPLTAPHKPTWPHERFRGKSGIGEYGDFVVQVDWTVGRVLEALEKSGVADDTLVVFSSDNGSYMFRYGDDREEDHSDDASVQGYRGSTHRANGPFRGTKADVWEGGHHVPLIVRWPGRAAPGSRADATVCLTDLYATCAQAAGRSAPEGDEAEDSRSLVPLIEGKEASRGAPVVHHSVQGFFAIRDGRWKLVLANGSGGRERPRGEAFGKPYQLYDMSKDIAEAHDVAGEHPEVVDRLTRALEEIRERGRATSAGSAGAAKSAQPAGAAADAPQGSSTSTSE